MSRRMVQLLFILCATFAVAATPCGATDEQFEFYGLEFGITLAEAGRRVPLSGTTALKPGHGMSELKLVFDREELLMEIHAGWPRPEEQLELQGTLRALREKFVAPTRAKFPNIAVKVDEYSNRAAIRLVFLSTGIREKNIDFYKNRLLKSLQ